MGAQYSGVLYLPVQQFGSLLGSGARLALQALLHPEGDRWPEFDGTLRGVGQFVSRSAAHSATSQPVSFSMLKGRLNPLMSETS